MAERSRLPIPFGGGLDRYTGTTAAEAAAFRDIRNVHLRNGGMEARGGLAAAITIAGETAILAVAAIRSLGIGALVTWNDATRKVSLYLVSGDGTVSPVGEVWTMPAGYDRPRVVTTDSYDLLFLAHDEPSILARQRTRVYKPASSTVVDLTADLYTGPGDPAGPQPVYFRGVQRHLAYLVGWGYGSERPDDAEGPGDKDRPEIVRMSLPGQPLVFEPNHYFIAGQRGEAVHSCQPTGNLLAVLKAAERYTIFGYDRATFGIRPADPLFGLAAQRLAVSVNGVVYHWSHSGPRRSVGEEPSVDLALPLDLDGPSPSDLAANADTLGGFAAYDPTKREVIFCFGKWAYVLHIGESGAERWSYREYGVEVITAGTLSLSASSGIGPDALALFVSANADDYNTFTVQWDADTAPGPLLGDERIELWGSPATTPGVWSRLDIKQVTGDGTPSLTVDGLPGVEYALALRLTRNGTPSAGYTDANPANWPAGAQGTVTLSLPVPGVSAWWERLSSTTHQISVTTAPLLSQDFMRTRVEFSTDGGGSWNPVPGSPAAYEGAAIVHDTSALALGSAISYRARYETDWATGDWGQVDTFIQLASTGVPHADVALFTACETQVTVTIPSSIGGGVVTIEVSGTNYQTPAPSGGGEATFEATINCTDADTTSFRSRNERTVDGVTDVSPWTDGAPFELVCNPGVAC